jgi:hypothetical protein
MFDALDASNRERHRRHMALTMLPKKGRPVQNPK